MHQDLKESVILLQEVLCERTGREEGVVPLGNGSKVDDVTILD